MLKLQKLQIPLHFNIHLIINKSKQHYLKKSSRLNLRKRLTSNIGFLVYFDVIYIRNVFPKYDRFLLKHPVYTICFNLKNLHCVH